MLFTSLHLQTIHQVIPTNALYAKIIYIFTYSPSKLLDVSIFLDRIQRVSIYCMREYVSGIN